MIKKMLFGSLFWAMTFLDIAHAGTCTTISRTNYNSGDTLTASALNTDFNNLIAPFNSASGAMDLGCGSDGTLEKAALNATDFDLLLNAPKVGCAVTLSDSNTLSVDRCRIAVTGWVKTTVSTTVTWGCTDCSSEVVSTTYYLYARATSSGSTLNLLISQGPPLADGFDSNGNRVLAKFYNDASSDIRAITLTPWDGDGWKSVITDWASYTPTWTGLGTVTTNSFQYRRVRDTIEIRGVVRSGTVAAADMSMTLPPGVVIDSSKIASNEYVGESQLLYTGAVSTAEFGRVFYDGSSTSVLFFAASSASQTAFTKTDGSGFASNGDSFSIKGISIPALGL